MPSRSKREREERERETGRDTEKEKKGEQLDDYSVTRKIMFTWCLRSDISSPEFGTPPTTYRRNLVIFLKIFLMISLFTP